ncbi:MAG: hypothetical protein BMS9Abin05_0815 [Rhodothermia bacterium]|nr:MAG: hypothetical protein BMS9Abin05_0815 [Rhodothermia bacterium]
MKALRTYLLVVALALGGFLSARNLSAQDAGGLLRTWMEGQRSAVEAIGSLRVTESVEQVMDSGFGKQELRLKATRQVGPEAESPGRTISWIRFNGRELPIDRGNVVRRRLRRMLRPEMARLMDAFRFPVQAVARMAPPRTISQEDLDGAPMWRVDSVPRNRSGPYERFTAWFDEENFHLQATQAILSSRGENSLRIRTAYDRFDGIDLPVHRQIEGSTPVRRRMRFFTMLFKQRVEYSDFEISLKD